MADILYHEHHQRRPRVLIGAYGGNCRVGSSGRISQFRHHESTIGNNAAATGFCYPQQAAALSPRNNLHYPNGGRAGSSNFRMPFVPTTTMGSFPLIHGPLPVGPVLPVQPPLPLGLRPPGNLHYGHSPPLSSAGFRPPVNSQWNQGPLIPNGPLHLRHLPQGPLPPYLHSVQNPFPVVSSSNQPPEISGLLTSLLVQGVISLPKLQSPDHLKEGVPIGVEFKPDLLNDRHEPVICALYSDIPRQCTTCGLRFNSQEEHRRHMDWHVAKNRMSKKRLKQKQMACRKWFLDSSLWHIASTAEAAGPQFMPPTETVTEKKRERDEETEVPADENQTSCVLCGERFEDYYSHEAEEWMYKDAMYLSAAEDHGSSEGTDKLELGPIVHPKCRPGGSQRKRLRRN